MPAKKTPADATPIEFESAMKRLETIVEELESGELTLEDSIRRYEEGVKLSRGLTAKLDEAEKRIERLVEGGEGEAPRTESMELDARGDDGSGELPF
jgi:exodeoxyribonuclease VII small subunit